MQALWMVLAAFFFATMGVCIKNASHDFSSIELVFYRGVIGMVFIWALARARRVSLHTAVPMMHAWRSAIGVVSLMAWFYAIAHLPLATAMTLNYMSSIWIAAFLVGGSLLLGHGEKQGPLVLTVLAGFAGVVLLLHPTIEQNQMFAGLIGLLSGIGAAFAYMQVMAIARLGEPDERTVFFFAIGTVIAGGIGSAIFTGFSPLSWHGVLWMLPAGLLASLGQLCMTRAYSRGSTLVVASLQYSGIVFAALYSMWLFGDHISLLGWLGMGLIVTSGVVATVLRSRAVPNAPAEEH